METEKVGLGKNVNCFKFEVLEYHRKYQIGSLKLESGAQERGYNGE